MEQIENNELKIAVNPIGAELSSIKKKSNQKQYLWQGDLEFWKSQAPVLFPIVGGLKDEFYLYKNKKYSVPKHGFIRYNPDLKLEKPAGDQIVYSYASTEATKKNYPFDFKFKITYELADNRIIVNHEVKNTGDDILYFAIGGHPAFNCPLNNQESYEDYYIQLQNGHNTLSYVLNSSGLITDQTKQVMEGDKIHLTTHLFDDDALIFKNIKAEKATLVHKENGAILSVNFSDFPDLGIWAKPKAPFICVEPWLGYADLENSNHILAEKEGIQSLNATEVHHSSYTISIL
ncbi:aldose 1-epimerase family protein [Aquimarina sp. ERC-38]|uniref:aldose 1-epimerase family protein n=1 Tax=Aquimarina sp. ERC-38 TaxID=2949996 RepID=UPI00224571B6|nr:aldose 1-epimerase family protein [Aquimarina sp. ERC-38]UZO79931.1 aldose 1-epimerase family protein [Aquimarina sp. ERC-38]